MLAVAMNEVARADGATLFLLLDWDVIKVRLKIGIASKGNVLLQ